MTRRYKRPLPYAQQAALIKAYRNPPHVTVDRNVGTALIKRGLAEQVGAMPATGIRVRLTEAGRFWNLG